MEDMIPCPYCGELNVVGSNICSRCFKPIRDVANPERADFEQTAKTKVPTRRGILKRFKHFWNRWRRHVR